MFKSNCFHYLGQPTQHVFVGAIFKNPISKTKGSIGSTGLAFPIRLYQIHTYTLFVMLWFFANIYCFNTMARPWHSIPKQIHKPCGHTRGPVGEIHTSGVARGITHPCPAHLEALAPRKFLVFLFSKKNWNTTSWHKCLCEECFCFFAMLVFRSYIYIYIYLLRGTHTKIVVFKRLKIGFGWPVQEMGHICARCINIAKNWLYKIKV